MHRSGAHVPKIEEWKGMLCTETIDPSGNRIGVVSWNEQGYENTDSLIRIGGYFLPVKSLRDMQQWYEKYFGVQVKYSFTIEADNHSPLPAISFGDEFRLTLVETGDRANFDYSPIAVTVEKLDETLDLLEKSSVNVEKESNQDEYLIEDIEGNPVRLVKA